MESHSKIRNKIEEWLSEENLTYFEFQDNDAKFHFIVNYPDQDNEMHILQPNSKKDSILILSGAFVEPEHISKMEAMGLREREELFFSFRDVLNQFPSEFFLDQSDSILKRFVITYQIFSDGLTKDHLYRGMGYVLKSKLQGIWEIQRKFGFEKSEKNNHEN